MPTKETRGRPRKVEIPQQFECFGHTIQVLKVPQETLKQLSGGEELDGLYDHDAKKIYLDNSLSYSELEVTYQHEKAHCILLHMGEDELSENEKFVELMGQILYQIEKSSKGVLQVMGYRKGVRVPGGSREARKDG